MFQQLLQVSRCLAGECFGDDGRGLVADTGNVAKAKRFGLPDSRIARVLGISERAVRARRPLPGRLAVDSCAAEFEAETPYYYLS